MELKMTPRKRSAEAVDPVLSTKRRLNDGSSSNSCNTSNISSSRSSSSRVTKVRFSIEKNSEQTPATDIYDGLSEEECQDLRSRVWYTVRKCCTWSPLETTLAIAVLAIKQAIAVLMNARMQRPTARTYVTLALFLACFLTCSNFILNQ